MPSPFAKDHLTLLHRTTRKVFSFPLFLHDALSYKSFPTPHTRCSVPPTGPWDTAPPDCREVQDPKGSQSPGLDGPALQTHLIHSLPFPNQGTPVSGS